MTTPDTVPTITADDVIPYLKDKKDFIYEGDSKFTGLNSEYAYVVRYEDVAICIYCVHGQLYVRETPRANWPTGVMLSVLMAYSMSGLIATEDMVPCSEDQMFICCMAHGVQDDAATDVPEEILGLAHEIMRKPGE